MERKEVEKVTVNNAIIRIMPSSNEKSIGLFIEILSKNAKRNPETVARTALSFRIVS